MVGKMNSSGFALTKILGVLVLICNLFIWPLSIYAFIFSMPKFLFLIGIKFLTDFIILYLHASNSKISQY